MLFVKLLAIYLYAYCSSQMIEMLILLLLLSAQVVINQAIASNHASIIRVGILYDRKCKIAIDCRVIASGIDRALDNLGHSIHLKTLETAESAIVSNESTSSIEVILIHVDEASDFNEIRRRIADASDTRQFDVLFEAGRSYGNVSDNIWNMSMDLKIPLITSVIVYSDEMRWKSLISFKQDENLIAEVARDVIRQMNRLNRPVKVLYTMEYRRTVAILEQQLRALNLTIEMSEAINSSQSMTRNRNSPGAMIEFLPIENDESIEKQIRKLRRIKGSLNLAFGNSPSLSKLIETANENDLFRSLDGWFVLSNDRSKITCSSCKHVTIRKIAPQPCSLHHYDGDLVADIPVSGRVNYYFHYDLTRLLLSSLLQVDSIDMISDRNIDENHLNDRLDYQSQQLTIKSVDELSRRTSNLLHMLNEQSKQFFGYFGEFVIKSPIEPIRTFDYSYQDIQYDLIDQIYFGDKRSTKKVASWFYSEPEGSFVSTSYSESDQQDSVPLNQGNDRKVQSTDSAIETTESEQTTTEPKSEDSTDDSDTNAPDPDEVNEREERFRKCPCLRTGKLTFIVVNHPPFVFVNSQVISVNSSLVQVPVTLDLKNPRLVQNFKPANEPFVQLGRNVTVVFSGFLIDLLEEIVSSYKNVTGEEFTDYAVELSTHFPVKVAKEETTTNNNRGGFGARLMKSSAQQDQGDSSDDVEFKGMIREISDCRCKVALMPMTPTPERKLFVRFTEPFFDTVSLSILMKKPMLQYHYWKFVSVLQGSVWASIGSAYFITSVLVWFFDRTSPFSYRNAPERYKYDSEKREFTFKEALWFCIISLTPQGGGEAPKALSGRLVAATWWLFGFIVIASYTANLAAFLTVSRLDHPINNYDELTRQYKIKYAPFEGSTTRTYFERMARIEEKFYQVWKDLSLNDVLEDDERAKLAVWDYPITDRFTKVWAAMSEATPYLNFDDAIFRVRASQSNGREGHAFVGEVTVIDYAVRVYCDLMKVGGEIYPRPNAFAYSINTTVHHHRAIENMNEVIYRLKHDGLIDKLRNKWWYESVAKKKCPEHRQLTNGITLRNAGGIFIIIAFGAIVTLAVLHVENYYYDLRTRLDMKKSTEVISVSTRAPRVSKKCLIQ